MKKYYLRDYIENFDGELINVEVIDIFDYEDWRYHVLRRDDGMEFVVQDYERDDEYIWVSVKKSDDYIDVVIDPGIYG